MGKLNIFGPPTTQPTANPTADAAPRTDSAKNSPAKPVGKPADAKPVDAKPAVVAKKLSPAEAKKAAAAEVKLRRDLSAFAAKPPESLRPTVFILADAENGKSHRIEPKGKVSFVVSESNPPRLTVSLTLVAPVSNEERMQIGQKYRQNLQQEMKRAKLPEGVGQLRIDIAAK